MIHPERIVPDETEPGIVAIHLKRYEFALSYCTGRDVLNAGCGVGYGTVGLALQLCDLLGRAVRCSSRRRVPTRRRASR